MEPFVQNNSLLSVQKQEESAKGCTTCKKKAAQDSFNLLTAGSTYHPEVNTTFRGPYVNDVTSQARITTQSQPFDAIGELYGGKLPVSKPVNTIDDLYGRKMPEYKPVNVINNSNYSKNQINTVGNNSELLDNENDVPCQRKRELGYAYQFPNSDPDNVFLKRYLPSLNLLNSCIYYYSFIYEYPGTGPISVLVEIDLKDCCKNFIKEMYCVRINNDIKKAYKNFYFCLARVLRDILFKRYEFNIHPKINTSNFEHPKIQLHNHLEEIQKIFNIDQKTFIDLDYYTKNKYSGYNGVNKRSCVCGGSGLLGATYCCYPDDDPEKCYCEDGRLKNLCEPCDFVEIEFLLPKGFYYSYKKGVCYGWLSSEINTKGELIENDTQIKFEISCPVSNYKEENDFEYTKDLALVKYDSNDDGSMWAITKKLFRLPKEDCSIKVILRLPCWWCCESHTTIPTRREWEFKFDFIYHEYLKNPLEYSNTLFDKFEFISDAVRWTDSAKECKKC